MNKCLQGAHPRMYDQRKDHIDLNEPQKKEPPKQLGP